MASLRLAVDAMGGDYGLRATLPASIRLLSDFPDVQVCLVGDSAEITKSLPKRCPDSARLQVVHADSVVSMDEKPSRALRSKQDSSMGRCLQMLGEGKVDAVVTAGNTGALMALGCLFLRKLPGVRRPAICAAIPAKGGLTLGLDMGANLECSAEELRQFALMGSALFAVLSGSESPRVGVLNVGEESIKGTDTVRFAAELISADDRLNFVGFVEGNDYFSDSVDVVVSDGFVGNVALKACEGTATFIAREMKQFLQKRRILRLLAICLSPFVRQFQRDIDPRRYNGAALLGLNGVVVKAHGSSEADSYYAALCQALRSAQGQLPQRIAEKM